MLNFSARLTEHCTRSKSARPGDRELFFSRPKLNVSRLRRLGAVRVQPCCMRQESASEQHINIMKDHLLLNTIIQKDVKLINKMSSGAGTLKVEGPAAQEWGIAFKVTMATKRALATWYCHTEGVQ